MLPKYSTPVPNRLFDEHLKRLKGAELKVLLVIIRQTLGWRMSKHSHQRKTIDWIAPKQFEQKTGLSRKSINQAIISLKDRGLIQRLRKNNDKRRTFYSCSIECGKKLPRDMEISSHAQGKKVPHPYTKETFTKPTCTNGEKKSPNERLPNNEDENSIQLIRKYLKVLDYQ